MTRRTAPDGCRSTRSRLADAPPPRVRPTVRHAAPPPREEVEAPPRISPEPPDHVGEHTRLRGLRRTNGGRRCDRLRWRAGSGTRAHRRSGRQPSAVSGPLPGSNDHDGNPLPSLDRRHGPCRLQHGRRHRRRRDRHRQPGPGPGGASRADPRRAPELQRRVAGHQRSALGSGSPRGALGHGDAGRRLSLRVRQGAGGAGGGARRRGRRAGVAGRRAGRRPDPVSGRKRSR